MAFCLDYETSDTEGITIKAKESRGQLFYKNYKHFGWELVLKNSISVYNSDEGRYETSSIYRHTFERSKHLVNYDKLCKLEDDFQDLTREIDFRQDSVLFPGDKVLPDYIDYESDEPIMPIYKISVFTAIVNTVLCFAFIGFLMWFDTLGKLRKNKKAKRYAEIKEQVKEIFKQADTLD